MAREHVKWINNTLLFFVFFFLFFVYSPSIGGLYGHISNRIVFPWYPAVNALCYSYCDLEFRIRIHLEKGSVLRPLYMTQQNLLSIIQTQKSSWIPIYDYITTDPCETKSVCSLCCDFCIKVPPCNIIKQQTKRKGEKRSR